MKFWRLHRPGYRVLKTVIATTLTLLVCSRFSKMSPVLALMGAYCAMGRTCDVTRSVSKMTEIERRGGKRWDKPKKAEKSRDCGGGKF